MNVRLSVFVLFALPLLSGILYAQSFEEYQKQEASKMQKFATDQQEGMAKLQKEYADFVAKRDQEWSDYLKKEWVNYKTYAGKPVPEKPKPKTLPVFTPSAAQAVNPDASLTPAIKPASVLASTSQEPVPLAIEPIRKPAATNADARLAVIHFYGRTFQIKYDPAIASIGIGTISQQAIGSFWDKVSAANYTPMVENLLEAKTDLNVNDFGYMMLVQKFSDNVYPTNKNTSRLLSWFILVRSGYSVRIGYLSNEIGLLIPTLEQVYQKNYLTLNGTRYYIFPELQSASFYTYDKDYQSGRLFDFRISAPLNLGGRKVDKTLNFEFDDKPIQVNISYDPDLIEFYKDYPMVGFEVYFDAALSTQSKETLAAALKPLIDGMDELKATNLILRFVQTAFAYKTDPEQFGREKYFFAEELFYYPFCDCEDRSVLFSYLVRELLGLKTIGLEYTGHISTAVAFSSEQTGDCLVYNNNRYIIADPTYINAPVGLAMPEYKIVSPIVHELANNNVSDISLAKIWGKVMENGCYKGSSRKNSKMLENGESILTGYFSDQATVGTVSLTGTANTHTCFVAKMNRNGEVLWAKSLASTGNAVGMSVETTPSGSIVVAGVFTGAIGMNGKSIRSANDKSDLFMASFSPTGTLLWLNRAALETLPQESSTAFSVQFDPNGTKLSTNHAGELLEENEQGLYVRSNGGIIYTGMVNYAMAVSGNDVQTAYAAAANADLSDMIKTEADKFIAQQSDKSMAGLLGALRLVKDMGVTLTGVQAQQAINKQNPNLRTSCPNIYKNIGLINFVKNSKGIITIMTVNGKDIGFDKVKITNNSTISVSEMPGSNFKIDVLSGIKVGKAIIWFDLNFIKLIAKNGNLVFDYAGDHSQATVNLSKDILN